MFSIEANDVELRVWLLNYKDSKSEFWLKKIAERLGRIANTDLTWADVMAVNWTMLCTVPWSYKPVYVKDVVVGTIKAWKNAR